MGSPCGHFCSVFYGGFALSIRRTGKRVAMSVSRWGRQLRRSHERTGHVFHVDDSSIIQHTKQLRRKPRQQTLALLKPSGERMCAGSHFMGQRRCCIHKRIKRVQTWEALPRKMTTAIFLFSFSFLFFCSVLFFLLFFFETGVFHVLPAVSLRWTISVLSVGLFSPVYLQLHGACLAKILPVYRRASLLHTRISSCRTLCTTCTLEVYVMVECTLITMVIKTITNARPLIIYRDVRRVPCQVRYVHGTFVCRTWSSPL